MKNIQGFVTIADLVSNQADQISVAGELSAWSKTFSLDRGEYIDAAVEGYRLVSFASFDDTNGSVFVVDPASVNQVLRVARATRQYAESHTAPYDTLDFVNSLLNQFTGSASSFEIGDLVDYEVGSMPEWVSWTSSVGDNASIKIWLVDQAFRSQYENYRIVVIPTIPNLDEFFNDYGQITTELSTIRPSSLSDKMQAAKEFRPETVSRIHDYLFYNSLNVAQRVYVSWGILIYGQAGDNIDSIKDALIDYILENSSHSRTEWEVIFPDIFKRTEFAIIPQWQNISIDNITELAQLYSQIVSPTAVQDFMLSNFPTYTETQLQVKLRLIPYPYKHLQMVVMSGEGNDPTKAYIEQLFPDYLAVPTTSLDFNRMMEYTRNWLTFLFDMVTTAETMTAYTTVPVNLRRVRRNGILYVSALYDNINYLVAARSNSIFDQP